MRITVKATGKIKMYQRAEGFSLILAIETEDQLNLNLVL